MAKIENVAASLLLRLFKIGTSYHILPETPA
jgi:hypothetical protein